MLLHFYINFFAVNVRVIIGCQDQEVVFPFCEHITLRHGFTIKKIHVTHHQHINIQYAFLRLRNPPVKIKTMQSFSGQLFLDCIQFYTKQDLNCTEDSSWTLVNSENENSFKAFVFHHPCLLVRILLTIWLVSN